jgi:hypothetical protein
MIFSMLFLKQFSESGHPAAEQAADRRLGAAQAKIFGPAEGPV